MRQEAEECSARGNIVAGYRRISRTITCNRSCLAVTWEEAVKLPEDEGVTECPVVHSKSNDLV